MTTLCPPSNIPSAHNDPVQKEESERQDRHILHPISNGPVNPDQERLGSCLIRWHVCMREDLWKGEVLPYVLPHRYMHSQLEMMQMACVHEGGHVERQACPSTHSPSHTHAQPVRDDTEVMCV